MTEHTRAYRKAYSRTYLRKIRREARREGYCPRCRKGELTGGFKTCEPCRTAQVRNRKKRQEARK